MKPQNLQKILVLALALTLLGDLSPDRGISTLSDAQTLHSTSYQTRDVGPRSFHTYTTSLAHTQQYVVHEPIAITGNANFAAFGFPGEGTKEKPYVIAGLNITNKNQPLIYIEKTTMHFQIRDNLLNAINGTHEGIYLNDVINGTIEKNVITNCHIGIYVAYSPEITVAHNVVSHCWRGITDMGSPETTVAYNIVSYCERDGIHLTSPGEIGGTGADTVNHNTVSLCGGSGILNVYSHEQVIQNNVIAYNTQGINLWGTSNSKITNNTVINNTEYGISVSNLGAVRYIIYSRINKVQMNDFLSNNPGDSSQAYDVGIENIFAYNYWADHDNTDSNRDGIADTSYDLVGEAATQDLTPLVTFANPHCLSIPRLINPGRDELLQRTVTIEWVPAIDTWGYTVTYALYYSVDNGNTWTRLATGLTSSIYEWDTSTMPKGASYNIKVVATSSDGLTAEDSYASTTSTITISSLWLLGGLIVIVIVVVVVAQQIRRKRRI